MTATPTIVNRRMSLIEVAAMLGVKKSKAYEVIAEDASNKTPGKHFPLPVRNPVCKSRAEWNLSDVLSWMESGGAGSD